MFSKIYTYLAIVSIYAIQTVNSLPVSVASSTSSDDLPWSNPCIPSDSGPSIPSLPGLPTLPPPPPPSIDALKEELKIRIKESLISSETLRNKMFTHRLDGSLTRALYLEDTHYEGLPYSVSYTWQNDNDTLRVIKDDYLSISKLLVFTEQVVSDEHEYYNSSAKSAIIEAETKLYKALCSMHDTLACLNHQIENHVSRDVMPTELREISVISLRKARDYVISKDMVHFLYAAKHNYVAMTV